MRRITQVLIGASPGDAVTNCALAIDSALASAADTSICARHIHPELAGRVSYLEAADDGRRAPDASDLLILHVSIGEPGVLDWVRGRPERLILDYHNISPADAFEPYDPEFAQKLALGRAELAEYRDRAELALADSEYNAGELRALGYPAVEVIPLTYDPERLARLAPEPATTTHLTEVVKGPVVLYVGQILPHKRPDFLVEAYYILVTHLIPEAHLILVGSPRLPGYSHLVQTQINELELTNAWITGHVTDAELAAFYRRADVFATASEHEGFCAPLLEAMAFDLPVQGRGFGAVPDTVGDAGVVLRPEDGPAVFAESLAGLIEDRSRSADLAQRGRRRLGEFAPQDVLERISARLAPMVA